MKYSVLAVKSRRSFILEWDMKADDSFIVGVIVKAVYEQQRRYL